MRIKRIVIAIDASPTSLAALEATAELAARWDAEILGVFVEDTDLLRMATLPFAGEVGSPCHRCQRHTASVPLAS
jgi:nucleotide-binding universal stress UspA family protein